VFHSLRLVVFNAHMTRALIINDDERHHRELAAFRLAFQARRFKLLITQGIIAEYQMASGESFSVQLQPELDNHLRRGRAIYLEESGLSRPFIELGGVPNQHRAFILDAVAANAEYLITDRRRWLNLSDHLYPTYGLRIVTPERFVELEG
jgi:predicted nucleic acid-binding protein